MPNTSALGGKPEPTPEAAADRIRAEAKRTLVGRFFHTFVTPDGSSRLKGSAARRKWITQQGVVVDAVGDGYFLVFLVDHCEWLAGGRSFPSRHVVHIDRMVEEEWAFYDTHEEMQEALEAGGHKMPDAAADAPTIPWRAEYRHA
jgi:hypothetical protein